VDWFLFVNLRPGDNTFGFRHPGLTATEKKIDKSNIKMIDMMV